MLGGGYGIFKFVPLTPSGCDRWEKQVFDQRQQCAEHPCQRPLPVCPAEREQSPLPHHARHDHQGAQHEATRDSRHD